MAIKYKIPLFIPLAIELSPDSTTALHIAHCALINWVEKKRTIKYFSLIFINNKVQLIYKPKHRLQRHKATEEKPIWLSFYVC